MGHVVARLRYGAPPQLSAVLSWQLALVSSEQQAKLVFSLRKSVYAAAVAEEKQARSAIAPKYEKTLSSVTESVATGS